MANPILRPPKLEVPLRTPWAEVNYAAINISDQQRDAAAAFNTEHHEGVAPTLDQLRELNLAALHPTLNTVVPTPALITILASYQTVDWNIFFEVVFTGTPENFVDHIKESTTVRRQSYLEEILLPADQQAANAAAAAAAAAAGAAQLAAAAQAAANAQPQPAVPPAGQVGVDEDGNPLPNLPLPAAGANGAANPLANQDVTMQSVGEAVAVGGPMQQVFENLSRALEQSTSLQMEQVKQGAQRYERQELHAANGYIFYGIEDPNHLQYVNPETFLLECENKKLRFGYSDEAVIGFFRMSLRGPAAAWFAGLTAMERDRSLVCVSDWHGLKRIFRQQWGIGGSIFYIDFKELLGPRKHERAGPYIARVREGMDKFLDHFGRKLYELAFPKIKNLLRKGAAPPTLKDTVWSFRMPADVSAEVYNIITIASNAHPLGQRDQARLWLTQEATAGLTSHLEDACMRYLKRFMQDSFTDFLHIFRSKVEWFDCINHLEDQKLREYAITASRTAFKKDKPMSTVELWNMIEQKERNYNKPGRHFAPPPPRQHSRVLRHRKRYSTPRTLSLGRIR